MNQQLFIVSAPSGAGKTSLVDGLLARLGDLRLSVSHTTRPARRNEIDGQHYHFVSLAEFEAQKNKGGFVEYAHVHHNWYGTSKEWLTHTLQTNDIVLEIDWQGAQQIRRLFPNTVGIFIMPPSFSELENRLRRRETDSDDVINIRLAEARQEAQHAHEFDFIVINDQLEQALNHVSAIVQATRLSARRQTHAHPHLFSGV